MDRIEILRAFITVVDAGSFSVAADRLGHSPQVISKYVRALEADLDSQLLYRTTRTLALTEAGRAFLPRCRQVVEEFDELRRDARNEDSTPRGHLVITAPVTFGERILASVVQRFLNAYADISIELKLTDKWVNLVDEGVDLAIRIGTLDEGNLIVRKIGVVPVVCCASPAYLGRTGRPKRPSDLGNHTCILDSNFRDRTVWRFRDSEGSAHVPVAGRIMVNSAEVAGRLAIGGAGIAYTPAYVVQAALASGALEAVLSDHVQDDFGLYAAYLPSRHLAAKVRVFIDHLAADWQENHDAPVSRTNMQQGSEVA